MVDNRSKESRSKLMSRIGAKNTAPELKVRSLLHAMGYRYRLHRKDLPGKPDIVFPSRQKVIFVHGCYWHGHGCKIGKLPKSNLSYWRPKIERNKARDREKRIALEEVGWSVLEIWQCETKDASDLTKQLELFLGS